MDPRSPPLVLAAVSVGAVLDQDEVVLHSESGKSVHVCEAHRQVDRKQSARSRRDRTSGSLRIEAIRVGINIREDGYGSHCEDGGRGAFPSVSRHDDLIAKADPSRLQGCHQCDRSVGYEAAVAGAVVLGKTLGDFPGEPVGEGVAAPVPAFQDFKEPASVGRAGLWPRGKRDGSGLWDRQAGQVWAYP
jgi:hypothetical protein